MCSSSSGRKIGYPDIGLPKRFCPSRRLCGQLVREQDAAIIWCVVCLRQTVQIIYAIPFVLISMIAFAVFGAIPRLRRHAVAALIAPAAFGFWALVGFVTSVLVCMFVLKIQLRPWKDCTVFLTLSSFSLCRGLLARGCRFGLVAKPFCT